MDFAACYQINQVLVQQFKELNSRNFFNIPVREVMRIGGGTIRADGGIIRAAQDV